MSLSRLLAPALLVCTLGTAAQATDAPAQANAATSVEVTTAMPHQQRFAETVEGYGSVQADPRTRLALSLPLAGQVTRLLVAPGQTVNVGQPLLQFKIDPSSRLAYTQAQQELKLAQAALEQTQALYKQRLATQSQLDTARKTLADAQANLATQRKLGGGSVDTRLRAPVSGIVETIAVTAGQRVAAATTLLQLAPAQKRMARIGIEPGDAGRLKPGQNATLTPVFGGTTLQGKLLQIAGAVNPKTRLIDVLVGLPADVALPLGSEVKARIDSGGLQAWAVPRGAVLTDSRGTYLFQVNRGIAHRVDVKLVQPDGTTVGVDGPIDPKRPVVVLGSYELTDGMHVRIYQ